MSWEAWAQQLRRSTRFKACLSVSENFCVSEKSATKTATSTASCTTHTLTKSTRIKLQLARSLHKDLNWCWVCPFWRYGRLPRHPWPAKHEEEAACCVSHMCCVDKRTQSTRSIHAVFSETPACNAHMPLDFFDVALSYMGWGIMARTNQPRADAHLAHIIR